MPHKKRRHDVDTGPEDVFTLIERNHRRGSSCPGNETEFIVPHIADLIGTHEARCTVEDCCNNDDPGQCLCNCPLLN